MIGKRGQGSVEFVIIFGVVLFFFIAFFSVVQMNVRGKILEKERLVAQNIALDVQKELSLAAESSEGYSRTFNLPQNILGKDYGIEIVDDWIYVSGDKIGVSYRVVHVEGLIQKGTNTIRKNGGVVYLNS